MTIGWRCLGAPEPVQGRGLVDEITAVPRPGADTAPRPACTRGWGLGLGPRRDLPALSFCAALCRRGSPCLCSGGCRGNHVPLFPGSVTSGKGYPPPLTTLAFPCEMNPDVWAIGWGGPGAVGAHMLTEGHPRMGYPGVLWGSVQLRHSAGQWRWVSRSAQIPLPFGEAPVPRAGPLVWPTFPYPSGRGTVGSLGIGSFPSQGWVPTPGSVLGAGGAGEKNQQNSPREGDVSDGVGLPGTGAALVRASPATGLQSEVCSETLPQGRAPQGLSPSRSLGSWGWEGPL